MVTNDRQTPALLCHVSRFLKTDKQLFNHRNIEQNIGNISSLVLKTSISLKGFVNFINEKCASQLILFSYKMLRRN